MECRIDDVVIQYAEYGEGVPLVALHGVGVDHRELEAALEPMLADSGCRQIYPDLPAMGESTADGLASNNDVVAVLAKFLESVADKPVLLLGHSYGAYLARGIAALRPELVAGLALVCPLSESVGQLPPRRWSSRTTRHTTSWGLSSRRASTNTSSCALRRWRAASVTMSHPGWRSSTSAHSPTSSPSGRSTWGAIPSPDRPWSQPDYTTRQSDSTMPCDCSRSTPARRWR
ncbi:alpha/beta fold hydrolase [Flexivirga alba]|uniref:Alpha/beta fold hydrolase n=1 Tax=Flexivirga alba TaxID=702742 RepID=A0ABW2AHE2_9MICO